MEQKIALSIIKTQNNFQHLLVVSREQVMDDLRQLAVQHNVDLGMCMLFDEEEKQEEFFELFSKDEDEIDKYLDDYLKTDLENIAKGSSGWDDPRKAQDEVIAVVEIMRVYVKEHQSKAKKRESLKFSSNRNQFNNSNNRTQNPNINNNAENHFSKEEKNKILEDLKDKMGKDLFDSILILTNTENEEEILFDILVMDKESALEELNRQLKIDIEKTLQEISEEKGVETNIEELDHASIILKNIATGYKILTEYIEDYIDEHQPSSPTSSQ